MNPYPHPTDAVKGDASDAGTNGVTDFVFSRPPHPLGSCGEAIGVSLPGDLEWRIRRLASEDGKTVSRFLCDLLCDEFAVGSERDLLIKHGRIVERFWRDNTGSNSGGSK